MKQRITVEQLQELTVEQIKKLCEWWQPTIGDFIIDTSLKEPRPHVLRYIVTYKSYLPLLSIGQMIELLEIELINPYPSNWEVEYYKDNKLCITSGAELTDALWSAVKEVL